MILIDDLISSDTTLNRAVATCCAAGAMAIHAVATHALFMAKANELLSNPELDSLAVTDSVRPFRLDAELARNCVPNRTVDLEQ